MDRLPNPTPSPAIVWPTAPMVQINVTVISVGYVQAYQVIIDKSPYEHQLGAQAELLTYEIGPNRRMFRVLEGTDLPALPPGNATIHTASTQAWVRHAPLPIPGNCQCNPRYTAEGRNHQHSLMCRCWGIGARIAEQMYHQIPLEDMVLEEELFQ
ncbi:hypothetical protein CAEBREN_23474 [Caenorhabditis brenneri]|uniref:Uncharacterized protein n=1 Tax=Caenorhabditis brenneri TaxID=135651 RepID=G0P8F1_CAEBE|nr:hypothetical protein CAEBREN_23474 [Caenorhabditis brenneri]